MNLWTNYFKVAMRSVRKQRGYAFINLAGLTLGLLCFLFLFAYVRHQQRYDTFHANGDRIIQGYMQARFDGEDNTTPVTPTALLPTLQRKSAGIETGTRLYRPGTYFPQLVKQGDLMFEETEVYYVDSTFFQVFSFPLLQGNPTKALTQPNSVVLTETAADKYFGTQAVVGETMTLRGQDFTVTGLVADPPSYSSFNFLMLASFSSLPQSQSESWSSSNYYTYLVLQPGTDPTPAFAEVNAEVYEEFKEFMGENDKISFGFIPLNQVHLDAPFLHELKPQANQKGLWILLSIGVLVLLIACINYMNLATARSIYRAREVGMRKVLGALRSHIFRQFMTEALLFTGFAVLLGVAFMFMLWPNFEQIAGETITQPFTQDPAFYSYMVVLLVVVACLAGSYPSLVLSGFRPLQVIKGSFLRAPAGQTLRKGLVVVQFSISALLIFGTFSMVRQLRFLQEMPLGYAREQVITVPITRAMNERWSTMQQEISQLPNVAAVGALTNSPNNIMGVYSIWVEGMNQEDNMAIVAAAADHGLVEALNLELLAGRGISPQEVERATVEDEDGNMLSAIMLNASAVDRLGESVETIVGKQARINGRVGQIVGVLKDFHYRSLHEQVGPLALFAEPQQMHYAVIRVEEANMMHTLASLETLWRQFAPERPFSYRFLDDSYAAMYAQETRQGNLVAIFAGIAIFIACLGLLGLASLAAIQRRKEVAIRKVIGATAGQLTLLLSRQFVLLIAGALVIALPLGYFMVERWLDSFAYRIEPGVGLAIICVVSVVGLGLGTVAIEALRAARANPIQNLKSE